jgi:GntR family transcriptional regulator/MocR family aminotransferase
MSKRPPDLSLSLRPRAAGTTLFRWLYDEIRTAILEGRLSRGSRLPSTRTLAREHGVARGTVVAAFDQLAMEGYLEGNVGSGTYVRQSLPDALIESHAALTRAPGRGPRSALSARGKRLADHPFPKYASNRTVETFRLDRPALDVFPIDTWSRLAARCLRRGAPELLSHGEPLGFRPLREAIAAHICAARGLRCTADEVVITSGTQQSLDLVARLLLDPGDRVWMEDPGYTAVASLLRADGVQVIGIPVDEQGIDCDAGRRRCRQARLAYVTPACQFPLGVTMSLERRLSLLQWASESDAWIFEDDYDGQLEFEGRPLAALRSLDRRGDVIYSNSFNKMLFPSLRIGFLVLPPALIDAAHAARSITQRFGSVLEQAILAEFIGEGHMEQHMRRMRELYTARREALIAAARGELGELLELSDFKGGLQIVGWLAPGIDELEAWRRAGTHGIDTTALSNLGIERRLPPGLVLGFAGADVPAIRRGAERLGVVLRELASGSVGASASRRGRAAPAQPAGFAASAASSTGRP